MKDVLGCARYPLCKKCKGPLACCESWKKRTIGYDFNDWLINREDSIEWKG